MSTLKKKITFMETLRLQYLKKVITRAEYIAQKAFDTLEKVSPKVFNEIDYDSESFYVINPIYKDNDNLTTENLEVDRHTDIIDEIINLYLDDIRLANDTTEDNIIGFIITFGCYSVDGFFEYWEYDPIQINLE